MGQGVIPRSLVVTWRLLALACSGLNPTEVDNAIMKGILGTRESCQMFVLSQYLGIVLRCPGANAKRERESTGWVIGDEALGVIEDYRCQDSIAMLDTKSVQLITIYYNYL